MNNLRRYTLFILNIADIVSILLASGLSFYFTLVIPESQTYILDVYQMFPLIAVISYLIAAVLSLFKDDNFLERSSRREFIESSRVSIYNLLIIAAYIFLTQSNFLYSRTFMIVYGILLVLIDFSMRILVKKKLLPAYRDGSSAEHVLIVGSKEQVRKAIKRLSSSKDWRYQIVGLVITDQNLKGNTIDGIQVLSSRQSMFQDILNLNADSVLILPDHETDEEIKEWVLQFQRSGKKVHLKIQEYDMSDSLRVLNYMGDSAVVTCYSIQPMLGRQAMTKRFLDVVFSILCMPLLAIISLIDLIFVSMEDHGHLLTHRVRVGKNGRRFYQLRFRVYRMDASERIKAHQSPYLVIGRFLRWSHLDGLPQLINVLSGEMSFTGPKAMRLPEFLNASAVQRSLVSVRPGITGFWNIENDAGSLQEEQQNYISNWNILKDLSIILVSFFRCLTGNSLRKTDQLLWQKEEAAFAEELYAESYPLEYDFSLYVGKQNPVYLFFKRLIDIILSLILIAILSPLLLILTILVIADDGGTPLYGHERIGKNGKRITIYKFRSMRMDAGDLEKLLTPEQLAQYKREFKIDNDPRITRIGEFLRKSSLDELPQLFNILGGSISFVGPRPIVEKETKMYQPEELAAFLSVKPGLTGYWQAYARNNATYETGERQKMELHYVKNASMEFDIKIFFHTFGAVISERGAQ